MCRYTSRSTLNLQYSSKGKPLYPGSQPVSHLPVWKRKASTEMPSARASILPEWVLGVFSGSDLLHGWNWNHSRGPRVPGCDTTILHCTSVWCTSFTVVWQKSLELRFISNQTMLPPTFGIPQQGSSVAWGAASATSLWSHTMWVEVPNLCSWWEGALSSHSLS